MNQNTILLAIGILLLFSAFSRFINVSSVKYDFGKVGVGLVFLYSWAFSEFDFEAVARSGEHSIKNIIFISSMTTYVVYSTGLILLLLQIYICYRDSRRRLGKY
jgi:hypothetical protein